MVTDYKATGERLKEVEASLDYVLRELFFLGEKITKLEARKRKLKTNKVTTNANA